MLNIRPLKSYQNTTPGCSGNGISIGQNGIPIDMLNPDYKKITEYCTLERFATATSRIVRYRGENGVTVSQHSVRGADFFLLAGEPLNAKYFLYHDVVEIMTGDMSAPIKSLPEIKSKIKEIEYKLEEMIFKSLGLDFPLPPEIKQLDLNLAQDEMFDMFHGYTYPNIWDEQTAYNNFINMSTKIDLYLDLYYNKRNPKTIL